MDVKKRKRAVFLDLMGELHSRVNLVKEFLEGHNGVVEGMASGAAEPRTTGGRPNLMVQKQSSI